MTKFKNMHVGLSWSGLVTFMLFFRCLSAADLIVSGPVQISTPSTYDSVVVLSGGTLTADAAITTTGKMRVASGGLVTHSIRNLTGLHLNIGDTLRVDGSIDVGGRGLLGAPGISDRLGETYNPITGVIIKATPEVNGASYGGLGGGGSSPAAIYGSEVDPTQLGSGGGGGAAGGQPGGNGGGAIFIQAPTLVLNGLISSKGANAPGPSSGGGGSGGTVSLDLGTWAGAGQLRANGGNSGNGLGSGGGAGGRIAVKYNTRTFTGSYLANGGVPIGSGYSSGSAGTIYLKDKALANGDLIFDNNGTIPGWGNVTLLASLGARTFRSVEVKNQGRLLINTTASPFAVTDSTKVSGSGVLQFDAGIVFSSPSFVVNGGQVANRTDWTVQPTDDFRMLGGSSITNAVGAHLTLPRLDGTNLISGTLTNSGLLDISTDSIIVVSGVTLSLISGSNLSADNTITRVRISGAFQSAILLKILEDLLIQSGGVMTADSLLTVAGKLFVLPNGLITHSARNLNGLRLAVSDTLWVQRGTSPGSIDVSRMGLRGGGRAGCGTSCGESYDTLGNIVCGPCGSTGGSYGGIGGLGATYSGQIPAYGYADSVYQLGGGGGSEYAAPDPAGGSGGGLVRITAGTVVVDGEIRADGQTPPTNCAFAYNNVGGGAGGGISIRADVFSGGGSAIISAIGGNGGCGNAGGGGGGRIAVFADNQSGYLGQLTARGGYQNNGQNKASAGTIFRRYSKSNATAYSDLLIDDGGLSTNYSPNLRLREQSLGWLRLQNGGTLTQIGASLVTDSGVIVSNNYSVLTVGLNAGLIVTRLTGTDLAVNSGGTFRLLNSGFATLDQTTINGGTFYTEVPINVASSGGLILLGTGAIQLRDSSTLQVQTFDASNFISGSIDMDATSRLLVNSGRIFVNSGLTIIKDGRFGMLSVGDTDVVNDLLIASGGKLSHSARLIQGLRLNVRDTLWVQRGTSPGSIDVSRMGLRGGGRAGCGTSCGESYDTLGNIVCGPCGSTGGSYGGIGGLGATYSGQIPAYGYADSVYQLGGGGGSEYAAPDPAGGSGGGLVRITAGTVVVDGEIRADGQTPPTNCAFAYNNVGGGAGGGISIRADVFSGGGSAIISAIGGNGGCGNAGGGGGGRIAVFADNQSGYLGQLTARGGYQNNGQNWASAGTIYRRNSRNDETVAGTMVIDNAGRMSNYLTPFRSSAVTFHGVAVRNSGYLEISKEIMIDSTLTVESGGRIGKK